MRSPARCLPFLLVLQLACGGPGDATTSSDTGETTAAQAETTTAPGETTGTECIPGYEGCACYEGLCLGGLSCASNLCVALPGTTESSGESETTNALDESSTSDAPSDTSTGDDTSSSSESSTTEVNETCRADEVSCMDGVLATCVDEAIVETTCTDQCALTGYTSPGCADDESCSCAGYLDETCAYGMSAYCYCLEYFGNDSCTAQDQAEIYGACFTDSPEAPIIECFASYVSGLDVDCDGAVNNCL